MFDRYMNVVKSCIKNNKLHAEICEELESHLLAEKNAYMEMGYDETAAELKSVEAMGDPAEMGEKMAGLHSLSSHQRAAEITFGITAVMYCLFGAVVHYICYSEGYTDSQNLSVMYVLQPVFYFICFIGLKMAMEHYRQSPVWLSLTGIVLLPLNTATSPLFFIFNNIFEFFVIKVGIDSFKGLGIILINAFSIVLLVVSFVMVIYPAVRVLKYIRNPYSNNRMKDRKRAKLCVLIPLLIMICRIAAIVLLVHQGELNINV